MNGWLTRTYVWADDSGDDRRWDDNTADTDAGKDEETPDLVKVVDAGDGETSASWRWLVLGYLSQANNIKRVLLTSCHQDRRDNQQLLVMTSEHTKQPKHNKSSCQDTKSNRQPSDSDANRIMSIDIKCLRGPEEQDGEEVGSGYEGDDEGRDENTGVLLEASGKHGEFGEFPFPDEKGCYETHSNEQRGEDVSGCPGVLRLVSGYSQVYNC